MLIRFTIRLCIGLGLALPGLWPAAARAQGARPLPPSLPYATYQYTGYTVYDTTSPDAPTAVSGVGGTLILRPDGSYEKHLSIVANSKPYYFNQAGRFGLHGDSIRFSFTDLKGADVQRGTFVFDSVGRHLTLTILGYPAGNKGVYELVPAAAPEPAGPAPLLPRPGRKRRR